MYENSATWTAGIFRLVLAKSKLKTKLIWRGEETILDILGNYVKNYYLNMVKVDIGNLDVPTNL